jgi:hypothetical protein
VREQLAQQQALLATMASASGLQISRKASSSSALGSSGVKEAG